MKTEEYIVTVKETEETKTFATLAEVSEWADKVRKTLGVWGGEPTFCCVKRTDEGVETVNRCECKPTKQFDPKAWASGGICVACGCPIVRFYAVPARRLE